MRTQVMVALSGLLFTAACASAPVQPKAEVDLSDARGAVEKVRAAGAEARAPEAYNEAVSQLHQAEAALASGDRDAATRSGWLSKLAAERAQCTLDQAKVPRADTKSVAPPPSPPKGNGQEIAELKGRLEAAQTTQKRLEEQVSDLQRERDALTREVVRTKVRLGGAATMEQASSAIAEARILLKRIPQDKASAARYARVSDAISRAESELRQDNYPAALFLALDAQEQAAGQEKSEGPVPEGTPAKKAYSVKSAANLRKGPGLDSPVVATLPPGTAVEALLAQGDWIKVQAGKDSGWIHQSLLQ